MRNMPTTSYRRRVLSVIDSSDTPLTGGQIARRAGIPYKRTIDALNGLFNYGRVNRTGCKFTARWCRIEPSLRTDPHPLDMMFERIDQLKRKKD